MSKGTVPYVLENIAQDDPALFTLEVLGSEFGRSPAPANPDPSSATKPQSLLAGPPRTGGPPTLVRSGPEGRWHSCWMAGGHRSFGDIAIDLGTANTVVYARGQGIVLFEPSVIAIDERTGEVLAVGAEAKRMIGRTPATIRATRPLRHGVIADFEVTEQMLRHFMRRAIERRFAHPRVVLCVPSGLTPLERDAVEEATRAAGARAVYPIEEPIAAAIGAGLQIAEPVANTVVDIGGGTTEVAVISLGSMVVWHSARVGGYEMDDAIVAHVKREHGLEIGEGRAEQLKIQIGSAAALPEDGQAEVNGRDLQTGRLRRIAVSAEEARQALEAPLVQIVEAIRQTLEQTPPELSADIGEHGIVLAGGGVLLRGFRERLHAETGLPIHLGEEPLTCVAVGAGRCLDELDTIARVAKATRKGGHRNVRHRPNSWET